MDKLLILKPHFSEKQKLTLTYLEGYQKVIMGELVEGIKLLDKVINQNKHMALKHKAIITKVSVHNSDKNYVKAFALINKLIPMLETMNNKESYQEALFVIAVFYNRLAQYHLSKEYLSKRMINSPSPQQQCTSSMLQVEAAFRLKELTWENIADNKVLVCEQEQESLASSIIYSFMANWYIEQNEPEMALDLLIRKKPLAKTTQYYLIENVYDSLISVAYFMMDEQLLAIKSAKKVIKDSKNSHKSEWLVRALLVMHKAHKKAGNFKESLKYHELYQNHLKLLNDDLNKRNISYQIFQEEVKDKAHQISLLDGKNKVLELEKELSEYSSHKKKLLIIILLLIVLALAYWAYLSKRAQLRLKNMAEHDELTGVFNRYSFNELAGAALYYCKKTNQNVSLILFDLDNFKRINDTYGHCVGDWVLKATVSTCKKLSRNNDIIGRFGGEEFTILLPGCDEHKAAQLAEKYRRAIFSISTAQTGYDFKVSASFGICPSLASTNTLTDIIKGADHAMYQAKNNGRNQVKIYDIQCMKVAKAV